jgi:hypothetical protein
LFAKRKVVQPASSVSGARNVCPEIDTSSTFDAALVKSCCDASFSVVHAISTMMQATHAAPTVDLFTI